MQLAELDRRHVEKDIQTLQQAVRDLKETREKGNPMQYGQFARLGRAIDRLEAMLQTLDDY
jgi:uncharacterized coiled-coil DUF342 family protein